jgi:hypothetical protein
MPGDIQLAPPVAQVARRIFLSYAREDRERAENFARIFTAQGWNVWWDRELLPGQMFDSEIGLQLAQAECVIVLWSATSVKKRWVRDEAEDGASRGILVPVLIDDVKIPLGFRRLQTENLVDWDGHEDHPGVANLLTAVGRRIDNAPAAKSIPARPTRRARLPWLALALGPTVFGLGLVWFLSYWKVTTPFRLVAAVSRIEFSVDTAESTTKILDSMPLRDIVFEKFSAFEIEPARGEIADSELYDIASDTFPASAWQPIPVRNQVIRFMPDSDDVISKVAIHGLTNETAPAGVLDAVRVTPRTTVTLETNKFAAGISLRLQGNDPRALFLWEAPVELVADHASVEGIGPIDSSESRSYRFYPKPSAPVASFTGRRSELVMSLRPGLEAKDVLRIGNDISVASVDFTVLDDIGRRVSSIVDESAVSFPDSKLLPERRLTASEPLEIRDIKRALLREVRYDATRSLLIVSFEGEVGSLRTGFRGVTDDVRSNALSRLRNKQPLLLWLLFGAWLISSCIGVVTLIRRSRSRAPMLSSLEWRDLK